MCARTRVMEGAKREAKTRGRRVGHALTERSTTRLGSTSATALGSFQPGGRSGGEREQEGLEEPLATEKGSEGLGSDTTGVFVWEMETQGGERRSGGKRKEREGREGKSARRKKKHQPPRAPTVA